jgi:poly(A) polymerase
MLKKLFSRKRHKTVKPSIVPRPEHHFSRKLVSKNALTVLYRLHNSGFQAYLVGGCVRDILLGIKPKDFDVATDAKPEEVRKLFRNCRLIGRRFRLAHIYFGRDIVEVATFRAEPGKINLKKHKSESGRILQDNVYGDIASDAMRRDFTINALYYNIADFSIVDYCNGLADIEQGIIALIGDPVTRYQEDPIRILRAARFAAKLDLQIAPETEKPIKSCLQLLHEVPKSRVYEECLKLLLTGHGAKSLEKLKQYEIQEILLPPTKTYTDTDWQFVMQGLENSDQRIKHKQSTSPGFLFSVLLWPAYKQYCERQYQSLPTQASQKHEAMDMVMQHISQGISIPKRFTLMTRSVWDLQSRLEGVKKHQAYRLLTHPVFRAGYDFLLLRATFDPDLQKTANWWQQFQTDDHERQETLLQQLPRKKGRVRHRRKRVKNDENA